MQICHLCRYNMLIECYNMLFDSYNMLKNRYNMLHFGTAYTVLYCIYTNTYSIILSHL